MPLPFNISEFYVFQKKLVILGLRIKLKNQNLHLLCHNTTSRPTIHYCNGQIKSPLFQFISYIPSLFLFYSWCSHTYYYLLNHSLAANLCHKEIQIQIKWAPFSPPSLFSPSLFLHIIETVTSGEGFNDLHSYNYIFLTFIFFRTVHIILWNFAWNPRN